MNYRDQHDFDTREAAQQVLLDELDREQRLVSRNFPGYREIIGNLTFLAEIAKEFPIELIKTAQETFGELIERENKHLNTPDYDEKNLDGELYFRREQLVILTNLCFLLYYYSILPEDIPLDSVNLPESASTTFRSLWGVLDDLKTMPFMAQALSYYGMSKTFGEINTFVHYAKDKFMIGERARYLDNVLHTTLQLLNSGVHVKDIRWLQGMEGLGVPVSRILDEWSRGLDMLYAEGYEEISDRLLRVLDEIRAVVSQEQ